MGSTATTQGLLESLPARPPTPPRGNRPKLAVPQSSVLKSTTTRTNLQTPPNAHDTNYPNTSGTDSRRGSKKVEFSAQTEYKDPPDLTVENIGTRRPTPVSLPSSTSKPTKSILKPHNPSSALSTFGDWGQSGKNWTEMLESTLQQLAGSERDSKVDAYMMLARALKESDSLPDRAALNDKMSLYMQFIQRDIVLKNTETELNTSLVNHALGLLILFLRLDGIARSIAEDQSFCVFLMDHCIRSLGDSSTPKDVARHLLQVIACQNFSAKVMTADRVGRLVSALHRIETHFQGKSIIVSRIFIYHRLIGQAKQQMISHSEWLLDLFTDMISSLKEIRTPAVALGIDVALNLTQERVLSRKTMETMNLTWEDRKYIEYYRERLKAMIKDKDKQQSSAVPQIWSVVMLLLRCPLDRWEHFMDWLHVIQDCFNSSDIQTKMEANYAWSRFAYMLLTDDRVITAPKKRMSMLKRPLIDQLNRKGGGKHSGDVRKAVLGGICTMFYYGFRPNTTHTLVDSYWDHGIAPLIKDLTGGKQGEATDEVFVHAMRILAGLFDCSRNRLWTSLRIASIQSQTIQPDELPAIDSEWVRRNVDRVFAVLEPILDRNFPALQDKNGPTFALWQALVGTIAAAAKREMKVSVDTTAFVAHAFSLLRRIWQRGPAADGSGCDASVFLRASQAYLGVMLAGLGHLPFQENRLSTDKLHNFVPSTSSHRSKSQGLPKAPAVHLFTFLATLPPGVPDNEAFAEYLRAVFSQFFAIQSVRTLPTLNQDLLSAFRTDTSYSFGSWLLVVDRLSRRSASPQSSSQSTNAESTASVSQDYAQVVKLLEIGVRCVPNLPFENWQLFFFTWLGRAKDESGDAGSAILLLEPLAKVSRDVLLSDKTGLSIRSNAVKSLTVLLSVARQPRDRQAVDAARRRITGQNTTGARPASFDPFKYLYDAANLALKWLNEEGQSMGLELTRNLLSELSGFFDRCNGQLVLHTLCRLQDCISPWIQDENRALVGPNGASLPFIILLWDKLSCHLIEPEKADQLLTSLEPLLVATFGSSHRHIVNSAVTWWNKTFGHHDKLQYPDKLKLVLVALHSQADILLPGLDVATDQHAESETNYIDSQVDVSRPWSDRPSRIATSRPLSSRATPAALPAVSLAAKRRQETPHKPPVRLRHDDSQVQFTAIPSSPPEVFVFDSQALTERQKEVRERQKETATIFPEVRTGPDLQSSAPSTTVQPKPPVAEQSPRVSRAQTPEPDGGFDDYVTSTPTPRRGQAIILPEHDLGDSPVLPLEPRRNPLAAEIRSRSAGQSLIDGCRFDDTYSSSPISGSPAPEQARMGTISQKYLDGDITLPDIDIDQDGVEESIADSTELEEVDVANSSKDIVKDSVMLDAAAVPERVTVEADASQCGSPDLGHSSNRTVKVTQVLETSDKPSAPTFSKAARVPRTPSHWRFARTQGSPRSSNDLFMDALTSPARSTPKRSQRIANQAKSPLALEVVLELQAVNIERSKLYRSTESPMSASSHNDTDPLDCIVVSTPEDRKRGRSRKTKRNPISADQASKPAEESVVSVSPPAQGKELLKRKRTLSRVQSDGGKRRKSNEPIDLAEVPDRQVAPVLETVVREEVHQDDVLGSSLNSSLVESPHTAPMEQPPAGDNGLKGNAGMDVDSPGSADQDVMVQSQIANESQSQQDDDGIAVPGPVPRAEAQPDADAEAERLAPEEKNKDEALLAVPEITGAADNKAKTIKALLQQGLDMLRSASLSRDEVHKIDEMMFDFKRELFAAELRGRH